MSDEFDDGRATINSIRKRLYTAREEITDQAICIESIDNVSIATDLDMDWLLRKALPYEVNIPHSMINQGDLVREWLIDNCEGRYYQKYTRHLFADKDDAIRFKLVWI